MSGKYTYRLNVLGTLLDDGYSLTAFCHRWLPGRICGHSAKLDLAMLCERLGRERRSMHWDIAPLLRCSKCGARGLAKGGPITIQIGIPQNVGAGSADVWAKPPAE